MVRFLLIYYILLLWLRVFLKNEKIFCTSQFSSTIFYSIVLPERLRKSNSYKYIRTQFRRKYILLSIRTSKETKIFLLFSEKNKRIYSWDYFSQRVQNSQERYLIFGKKKTVFRRMIFFPNTSKTLRTL